MAEPVETRLTVRRSIAVVAIALGIVIAFVGTGVALGLYITDYMDARSDVMFAGLGEALLVLAISVILGYSASIATVGIGTRGRPGAAMFTVLYAALLVGITMFAVLFLFIPMPGLATGSWLAILAFPLLWAVPAASVGVIRWNAVAIVLGGVAVLIAVGVVVGVVVEKFAQDARNAAYSGPAYGPSTSPQSPLEGFELYDVSLPEETDDYVDAALVTLAYKGSERSEGGYDLSYTEGDYVMTYCTGNPNCVVIGEALGQPVYRADAINYYLLPIDGGVIALSGFLSEEQVLEVYQDLKPMTLDEIGRLRTS